VPENFEELEELGLDHLHEQGHERRGENQKPRHKPRPVFTIA
jgi:hypothetical protein